MFNADPYVPAVPVFFNVRTPALSIVASLLKDLVTHWVPLAISRLPEVAVVLPKAVPLILSTEVVV